MVFGVPRRRALTGLVASVGAALLLAGCSTSGSSSADKDSADCAPYKKWQVSGDATVSAYSSIRDVEADRLEASWKKFEDCTGITIEHEGSGEFEAQLNVRVKGGNAPDLAFFPQPGLLASFVKQGKIKTPTAAVKQNANSGWSPSWVNYGVVNGTFYAAPLGANVKSFVWYSPGDFKSKGYTVPTTWAELIALSNKVVASGQKPWCAGIESGDATGWPATDWLEDIMLRTAGTATYDKWVSHEIPFNDPSVSKALNQVATILKNPKYVNAGYGDVKSISTTSFQEGGLPILKHKCTLHRQASFYGAQLPKGTKVGPDGDIFAFYFPAATAGGEKPVLGGGEFVGAFSNKKAVQNVQEYLSTPEWANSRAKIGSGWVSANKGLNISNLSDPIDQLSYKTLQDPKAVFRFDGSDLMPAQVGSGSEWKQMVAWINGQSTKTTLDNIEKSWPK
jgi:alpha-glucoside transport system substrate-binding protein